MTGRFEGRKALVTGSASGIGAAASQRLSNEGAQVIGIDIADGRDVSDPEMWRRLASDLEGLDIAVVNAGISTGGMITDIAFDEWRRTMAINLDGAFLTMQAAMRAMKAKGGGSIVATASISGVKAEPGTAAYGASKAALIQMVKVAAKEGAPDHIRVNAVAPGGVDTPIWDGLPFFEQMVEASGSRDAAIADMAKMATPLGRYASADEIAEQISFLLSDAASYMTGAVLVADGGYSL